MYHGTMDASAVTETGGLTRIGHPMLCYKCDATVTWAKTNHDKKILMDFFADHTGTFVIVGVADDGRTAIVAKTRIDDPSEDHFTCHFDTCGKPKVKVTHKDRKAIDRKKLRT